ncbi:MAG: ABC transporter permease [Proteobacteria bacterium]|nr:ABC transporter permease [Pseudomonadota bacterium]
MEFLRKYEVITLPLMAVLTSLVVGAFIILSIGENPLDAYWLFLTKSLFTVNGISYTLFYATPLIFTGLAVAFGFHCGLFNIGGEGQLYIGSMALTLVAIWLDGMSAWFLVPICIIVAFVSGGIWGGIPGFLKAKFGGHEVINTIMMNFIAFSIVNYFVVGPFHREGTQVLETDFIPEAARVFRFSDIFPFIPEYVPLNFGFILALLTCVFVYLLLWKTKWGYEIRAVGISNSVSYYAGIPVNKNVVLAMFLSGGFAGLVGIHEIMGYKYTFHDGFSGGVGFIGIAVALLGRNHPFGVVMGALLFGALNRGGLFLDMEFDRLSRDFVMVLQGVIVLFVATDQLFKKFLHK